MISKSHGSALLPDAAFDAHIERLFKEALASVDGGPRAWLPECNVYENNQHFIVRIAAPGLDPQDLRVEIENRLLRVEGERRAEPSEDGHWYVREVKGGRFACSFRVPESVDQEASTATYRQGMLTITFPKREAAKPRTILSKPSGYAERRKSMRIGHLWESVKEKASSWFDTLSWPRMRWSR